MGTDPYVTQRERDRVMIGKVIENKLNTSVITEVFAEARYVTLSFQACNI